MESDGVPWAMLLRILVLLMVAGLGYWYYLSREDRKRKD